MTVVLLSEQVPQLLFLAMDRRVSGPAGSTESKIASLFIIQDVLRAENGALHSVAEKTSVV